jgi:6-phosphogluconolactonase
MAYQFDNETGSLQVFDTSIKMPEGSGPRHFTFHPTQRWSYLLNELSGTVAVFQHSEKGMEQVQLLSMLPAGFTKTFSGADIHVSPDGRFLYTSIRDEANQIALFRINPATGKLTLTSHFSTLGKTPRNFNIDPTGQFLLVANQRSDEIVVFRINKRNGKLTDTGNRIRVGNPVCLQWINP